MTGAQIIAQSFQESYEISPSYFKKCQIFVNMKKEPVRSLFLGFGNTVVPLVLHCDGQVISLIAGGDIR